MKILRSLVLVAALLISVSCNSSSKKADQIAVTSKKSIEIPEPAQQDLSSYETAYFASGCFWCVEAIFESVKGIPEVVPGYAGGTEENPTYEQVGGGLTSHAEAVKVYYDPKVISFIELVQVFFGSHDPTTLNRQGPDRGPQYRSVAFYKNEKEKK